MKERREETRRGERGDERAERRNVDVNVISSSSGVCLNGVPICRKEKKSHWWRNERRKERHDVLHSCSSILLTTPTAEIHIQRHQPTLFFPFSSRSLDRRGIFLLFLSSLSPFALHSPSSSTRQREKKRKETD